jgi:hypothetical protein
MRTPRSCCCYYTTGQLLGGLERIAASFFLFFFGANRSLGAIFLFYFFHLPLATAHPRAANHLHYERA